MKDNLHDIDDPVPTYEESTPSANQITFDRKSLQRSLQSQLAETRSCRIRFILTAHIEPLLADQGLNGVARNTFILIPSDTLPELPNLTAKDLAGLPESARNATLVRLHGPDNQAAFWLQPSVVQQLSAELKCRFASSGFKLEEPSSEPQRPTLPARGARSSWLMRHLGLGRDIDPTASTSHWKLGWRPEDEQSAASRKLALDEIRINTKVKDVSVMTESELGLLLTETVKAIWLEVDVGT